MFANVAGSTGGAILTGWWALRVLGTADTLKALVTASAFFAIAGALLSLRPRARQWKSAAVFSIGLFAALTVARAMPSARALWAGLHGSTPERIVYGEDETGVSLLKVVGATAQRQSQVYVNGVGQSWIPYGQTHTILGALPAFLHPDPRDVVVIGLGSGDTAFALAGRDSVERITCVEIVKSQLRTLTEYDRVHGYEGLAALFRDPRVEHIAGDGRRFIMRAERQFDIIEADALRPLSAYSGNLYSDRYFELLRGRLKRGGLAVTWAPTARVRRTFLKVFSHAVSYRDILMGSVDPIVIDHWAARRRLADASVQQFYRAAGVDIEALLEPYLATTPERYEPGYDRSTIDDINTDLFPRDEFDVPPLIEWRSLRPANSAE
jgi:spermidine synthase